MNDIFKVQYNDRGELICDDIFMTDNQHAMINGSTVGDVRDGKLYVDNRFIGTIVKSGEGFKVLNDVALEKFRKYQAEQAKKKYKLRRRNKVLIIVSVAAFLAAGAAATKFIINAHREREDKKAEILQGNKRKIDEYFTDLFANGKLPADQMDRVLRPIEKIPAENMDTDLMYLYKIVLADRLGIDVGRAGYLTVEEPHYEEADDEWTAQVYYRNEDGNKSLIGYLKDLDKLSQEVVVYIIKASNIKPEKVTDETRAFYTNGLGESIDKLDDPEYEVKNGGFGM